MTFNKETFSKWAESSLLSKRSDTRKAWKLNNRILSLKKHSKSMRKWKA